MPSSTGRLFIVREAVLTTYEGRSAWRLTFTEMDDPSGETLVVTVSPAKVDDMYFARPYTRDEIEALASGEDEPQG
jgi:hypothetical protein